MHAVNLAERVERPAHDTAVLSPLMIDVIRRLNREGIRYCHWKSNYYLTWFIEEHDDRDLDLLIDRRDALRFEEVLASLGFKRAVDPLRQDLPSVHHYYGLDPETHHFTHLHIYHRILTGESILKNHALPIEELLLSNTRDLDYVRIPTAAVEVVLFVVRLMLKHASMLEFLLLLRRARLGYEVPRDELEWLLADCSVDECLEVVARWLPTVPSDLFLECLHELREDRSLPHRYFLAWKLRRCLESYNRFSRFRAVRVRLTHFWRQTWRKLIRAGRSKQFATGGTVIAFVGPEATGKSSLVAASRKWLGGVFGVEAVHAGKPPSSFLLGCFNLLVPLARRFAPPLRHSRIKDQHTPFRQTGSPLTGCTSVLYALRAVALAYDRRRLLVRARAAAANGRIVICDRYPCNVQGAMDSPRLQDLVPRGGLVTRIYRWLARIEQRLYRQIPPPDIVLRLHVSVEVAKQRNRDRIKRNKEGDEYLERRHQTSGTWHRSDARYTYDIETDGSFEETAACVQDTIWRSL